MNEVEAQSHSSLVSTEWVSRHGDDPNVRLLEVDVDTSAYQTGHIAGAIGWNWQEDLQHRPVRDIPSSDGWEALLRSAGINNDTTVVIYGDNNNWFAAFAFWLFKLYGHDDVHLMDGGRRKWLDESRAVTTEIPDVVQTDYAVQTVRDDLRAYRADIEQALRAGGVKIVDVRSPQEFSGELLAPANLPQEGAQRGGHIPGASNVPWATAVAEDGTFKPIAELAEIYGAANGAAITYCRIGERSAHTWFVLTQLLEHPGVRNYDGSWTEWGSLIGAPIEC